MKSWLPILALFFVFVALNIQSTEADDGEKRHLPIKVAAKVLTAERRDGYGHGGHGHSAKGTACIVKGSYCNCHYCKCEKGHVHCGGYGKGGHGKNLRTNLFFLLLIKT